MYRRRVPLEGLLCFEVPRHKDGGSVGHHQKHMNGLEWATQVLGTIKKHGSVQAYPSLTQSIRFLLF
jgi:hypothetical protein